MSMWPNNFELLSMVKEVSKRKHILEFPLFKKSPENQTKIELNTENIGWKEVLHHTNAHTHTHTHTQREYYAYMDTHK